MDFGDLMDWRDICVGHRCCELHW